LQTFYAGPVRLFHELDDRHETAVRGPVRLGVDGGTGLGLAGRGAVDGHGDVRGSVASRPGEAG
jgi:hypothetical protein